MRRTTKDGLQSRLANSNISTEDFAYIMQELYELRTCEKCKHYIEGGCGNVIVNCVFPLPIDFGCNKWMAKDD